MRTRRRISRRRWRELKEAGESGEGTVEAEAEAEEGVEEVVVVVVVRGGKGGGGERGGG